MSVQGRYRPFRGLRVVPPILSRGDSPPARSGRTGPSGSGVRTGTTTCLDGRPVKCRVGWTLSGPMGGRGPVGRVPDRSHSSGGPGLGFGGGGVVRGLLTSGPPKTSIHRERGNFYLYCPSPGPTCLSWTDSGSPPRLAGSVTVSVPHLDPREGWTFGEHRHSGREASGSCPGRRPGSSPSFSRMVHPGKRVLPTRGGWFSGPVWFRSPSGSRDRSLPL